MRLTLWTHCNLATLQAGAAQAYGLIEDGALVLDGGRIHWLGPRRDVPPELLAQCHTTHDAGGALITPGLIDCHTHLVYGGDRALEFEQRLNGASYEEIARQGGGIASTVRATRSANPEALTAQSGRRLQQFLAEGVTTLEIKSGYGLALEHERKCLHVARALGQTHAVPPEFAGRLDDYVDEVLRMLPQLHAEGLVDAVDAFCERIAFSPAQVARVFAAARALGLPVKLHAEQLSDSDGAALAAGFGALSCDHLEWLSDSGAAAMAAAGSVAVLLPGAFYFLRETKLPPIELLRRHRVPMAISTDCNPGTSPCSSLLLMLNMACTLFRLTPEESLRGATINAARALGLADRGQLAAGLRADFAVWDADHPRELAYRFGHNPCLRVICGGIERSS